MSSRMSRPDKVKLEISRGDWLIVRSQLNAGEYRAMLNYYMVMKQERVGVDPLKIGQSKMLAYLLDWSITDADDKPVVISGQPQAVIESALDNLDYDAWQEIRDAVEQHEDDIAKSRAVEKNDPDGESKSSATSPSPVHSAGDTNGSQNLTGMSIPLSSKKFARKPRKETSSLPS